MRIIGALALALAAWLAWPNLAAAQDAAQAAVARELERKARAGEPDNGFCLRAAPQLERLDLPASAERLNQILSRNDAEPVSLLFVVTDAPSGQQVCAYLAFLPAAIREGKKCRPMDYHLCIPDRECRAQIGRATCEISPGKWD